MTSVMALSFCRPKDAVAALRKRITSNLKNFHVINLSLTVSMIIYYCLMSSKIGIGDGS